MNKKYCFILVLLAFAIACNEKKQSIESSSLSETAPANKEREQLLHTYDQVPEASEILKAGNSGMAVYTLCLDRYTTQLFALKKEADALGAKLILTILSPEVGEAVTISTQKGVSLILDAAKKAGIEAYDVTTPMAKYTPQQITQMPVDGHWSEAGAKIVADLYQPIINAHSKYRSTKIFSANERPATLGDLEPGQDVALDGGKGIPYQLITNSQGFRMNYALVFPKSKQRILFLGDSQLYSPFLDNEQIPTSLLQQEFADKEIINAGVVGYTLDDQVALLAEKAKYTEPDIIILVTNPNDVGDFYFAQRNRMARSKKAYPPSRDELALYKQLFPEKK